MTMTTTAATTPEQQKPQVFEGLKKIGIINPHPDDHIPMSSLFAHLQTEYPDIIIEELDFTSGEDGGNLLPDPASIDFVAKGRRIEEGTNSSRRLGISTYTYVGSDERFASKNFEDGKLDGRESEMAPVIEQWAQENDIQFFVTLMTGDHNDHDAVARATRFAARSLSRQSQRVRILELQPKNTEADPARADLLVFPPSDEAVRLALGAALDNPSQFELTTTNPEAHPNALIHAKKANDSWITLQGFLLEPETHRRLLQYPIGSAAVFQILDFRPNDAPDEYDHAA